MSGAPLAINEKDIDIKDEVYDKRGSDVTSDHYTGEDGTEPSPEERATLRRIGDSMPLATWLVAVVELCERFTYYGASGLFPNYILKPLDGSLGRGALGLSTKATNGLTTFFQFFCYGKTVPSMIVSANVLKYQRSDTHSGCHHCGPISRSLQDYHHVHDCLYDRSPHTRAHFAPCGS